MRIVRDLAGGRDRWGRIDTDAPDDEVGHLSDAPWLPGSQSTGEHSSMSTMRLLAPVVPSKIVAVGRNYGEHARELDLEESGAPRIFFKPPSSVIGPGAEIVYPHIACEVHHEAELAVVIGRRCRQLDPDDAASVIFGYTCANDVTARDIQRRDGLPSFAKSFDTFCPLGPWIETELNTTNLTIQCSVNGKQRQWGHTPDMLWPVPELLAHITSAMTLVPGDVLLTGTPAGVGPLVPGDQVVVEIEGIGALENSVVTEAS